MEKNMIENPPHYTKHPSGVECIIITEEMSFNLGNAVKYIWRCDLKAIVQLKIYEKPNGTLKEKLIG